MRVCVHVHMRAACVCAACVHACVHMCAACMCACVCVHACARLPCLHAALRALRGPGWAPPCHRGCRSAPWCPRQHKPDRACRPTPLDTHFAASQWPVWSGSGRHFGKGRLSTSWQGRGRCVRKGEFRGQSWGPGGARAGREGGRRPCGHPAPGPSSAGEHRNVTKWRW